jgi:hypothetical protein
MDELCYAYEAGYSKQKQLPIREFADGDRWGDVIFGDLEAGASAWLYWNAILDETGGPWAVSPVHGNPDPNIQHPVVIINKTTHEITYTGTYYYLAHFSKFVRPGAIRVQTTGRGARLACHVISHAGWRNRCPSVEQQPVRCSDKFAAQGPYSSDDGTGTLDQHRFVVGRRLPAMQFSTSGASVCRPGARRPTFRDKRSKLRRVPNIRLSQ